MIFGLKHKYIEYRRKTSSGQTAVNNFNETVHLLKKQRRILNDAPLKLIEQL